MKFDIVNLGAGTLVRIMPEQSPPILLSVEQARDLYTLLGYFLAGNTAELCLYQRRKWEQWAGVADSGAGCGT